MVSTLLLAWIVGSFLVAPIVGRAIRASRQLPVDPVPSSDLTTVLPARTGQATQVAKIARA